jgi:hypothetical protein
MTNLRVMASKSHATVHLRCVFAPLIKRFEDAYQILSLDPLAVVFHHKSKIVVAQTDTKVDGPAILAKLYGVAKEIVVSAADDYHLSESCLEDD